MEIIKNEGVFRLYDKHGTLILTDEKQLDRIIRDPATPLYVDDDLGYSGERQNLHDAGETLITECEKAAARGCTRLEVSYDFFFGGSARHNYPSDETTVKAFKVIRDTAKEHGMAFGASILSPLDVGGGWAKISDETGFSYQFQETDIKPDGSYKAEMTCQCQWYNNKGPIQLKPEKVLVYAFNEERVGDTPYFYVDENAILDISTTAAYEIDIDKKEITSNGYAYCPMRIFGKWDTPTATRALCIMVYRTPELDYFAPSAPKFMKQLLDQHNAAGIDYQGFYSDEMHIQFDWDLEQHFGETEVTTRYLTPNLAKAYAARYGAKFEDFAKYLVYMSYHQHDFLPGEAGKENAQHVFGKTPADIQATWLFRNRYFELLQRTVVDLANSSKAYAEELWGGPIMTRAHATWQESPTCDHYYKTANSIGGFNVTELLGDEYQGIDVHSPVEQQAKLEAAKAAKAKEMGISRYEYTPWYDWSSSIRENISACYDYFKWNEFLAGGGTDHPEGGNLDRNYFAQALAASFGELNRFGSAYCAGWGMPRKIGIMRDRMSDVYGNSPSGSEMGFINDFGTRRTDVLALYPIKLNNVEERFGSWMVQYGYCNYITEEKLLENAVIGEDGTLEVKGQKFRCLVALFEPFLNEKTFDLLEKYLAAGGKVLWTGIPACMDLNGADATERFCRLFGLEKVTDGSAAEYHKGAALSFRGRLGHVRDMTILNDYLVDAVYPCSAGKDAESVASVDGRTVGVCKSYPDGGLAVFMGARLRDDQSCSLGEDVDTLFRVLCAIGAYRPGSLEVRSRETGAKNAIGVFANGAVAAAPHYREIYEAWEGKFFRDKALDEAVLAGRELPDGRVVLNEEINGHVIVFDGDEVVKYRLDDAGVPVALLAKDTDGITVDGVKYTYTDRPAYFQFTPIDPRYLTDPTRTVYLACCFTEGATLTVPVSGKGTPQVWGCRDRVFDPSIHVPCSYDGKVISYTATPELVGKQILIMF